MKRALTLLVALCTGAVMSFNAYADDFAAVKAIVGRLAGGYNGSAAEGKDTTKADAAMAQFVFVKDNTIAAGVGKVEPDGDKIKISASDASGASFALGQYMRHTAKINITWCGNRTIETYPLPTAATTYTPAVPVRFAYNYCTLSYTMAFWSENEWREEIDRLALSGYNVALVLQGLQEAWRVTLESVKKADKSRVYSDEQIMRYVSDEAAQAWWHMGNLEGLGGPLGGEKGDYSASDAYEKFTARCQKDAVLGEYIYAEMMKLGIQPSIQSFVGLVPDCSNQVLADGVAENGTRFGSAANWGIINEGGWQGYTRPDVVNPLNIAFDEMSKYWYGALVNIYKPATHGYTKYMGGDLFHEGGNKGSLTDANLADVAKKIQDTQAQYFGKDGNIVTWVIQSWQGSPYQGIRNGLDCKKAIIQLLDKDMSTTGGVNANYWNNTTGEHIPWIWVEVLNFGGNTGMHGGARRFRNLAKIGTASGHSDSFMGYGILSEGLETNPMMYDMFNDAFTREVGQSSSIDTDAKMTSWIHDYLVRRYGADNVCQELEDAYQVLIKTVFDCSRYQEGCVENILCAGGSYSVDTVSKWGPKAGIEYDTLKVHEAARKYLEAVQKKPELKNLDTFKYDFVELFLQILGERGRVINADCATSAKKRAEFLGLIDLAEKITACSPRWRLDWHEARTAGVCPIVGGQSEGIRGYRRMVTSWADGYSAGQATGLREYAHRGYSGLFKDYYKKRWEWFFQVTDGTISQAKYVQNLTELDATFPTAVLTPTPEGDMVAIANEIMEFLYPPALTWNGEADTTWAGANWTDGGTGATVAWTDGMDVNIKPANLTLTADGQNTGDMTLVDGSVAITTGSGYITTTAAVVPGLTGVSLEDLASKYSLTATMNGGWVKAGTATGRCVKFNGDKTELTVQFQMIDDGYLKDVIVVFAKDGENITAKATAAKNQQGGALGTDLSSTGGSASVATTDTAGGYGVKEIKLCRGKLTVNGPLTIGGTLYLGNNDLVFNGETMITQVSVDAAAAKGALVLGDSPVSIASLTTDGTKLVIKGESNVLLGGKLTLAKADLAKAVYVGPDGNEQTLVKAADGSVKTAISEKVIGEWIPKSVTSTGLYGVSLNELATRFVITGMMDGGFVPTSSVNAYCGTLADGKYTVQMQTVDGGYLKVVALEFTEVGGEIKVEAKWIRNRQGAALGTDCTTLSNSTNWGSPDVVTNTSSNGYGIYNLTLTPAVAMVGEVPYTTLASAITAANGGSMITIISDMTTGAISTYPVKLEVAEGVELTVTAGDFLGWNKAWELHVKGTVNLGGNALSYGEASYSQKIYIYEGGSMVNSSGHGFSVFKTSTIYVKHLERKEPALIGATLQARENITIDVEAGAKAIVNANVMDKDGQSGIDSPKIVKTGAGELVWNGYFQSDKVSLELNGGTLTRALEDNEIFPLTVTSGTANISVANPDYKLETVNGEDNLKTYKAIPRTYLIKVTNPGETGQNGAGKLFETYGEAATYAVGLQTANPAILVIMWTVVDNRDGLKDDATFASALDAYNTKHSTEETLDTITAKSPDGEQFNHALWDTDGIYEDPSKITEIYYPMGSATEWTAAVKGKNSKNEEVVLTAEDTVIFNQNFGPIYINKAILPRSMKVTDNSTLKLGFWNGTSSLPSGMTVTIDAGSIAQFDNWTGGKQVIVPGATINGEGTFKFGDTITSGSHIEIGTLAGTAALTLKDGVTVNVTGSIVNTLKGAGTIKVMNIPATFNVAADANITFVDGTTHDAREVMNVVKNGSTVSITHELIVARVGNTTYADLAAAIAAANVSEGKTITLYISEDDYFRNGAVSVGTADLSGLTVMVRMPDSREEFSMLGTFDPDNQQVTFNVYVRGPAALYDWTFDGNATTKGIASVGRDSSTINCDGSNNYLWAEDGSMQSKCHPYYGISWNGEFTLATFLSAGSVADTVLVALGNTSNSLVLIKDEGENMIKLVKIQSGTRSNVSGSILVPNLSQQHLYMITCSKAHDEIKLWIDGALWETIALDEPLALNEGFQIGSIYQGLAGGLTAENAAEPSVKMIRVFGNVLGKACAEALKKEFNYVSDNGAYQRTISSAAVNWVKDGAWTNLDTKETVAEPLADSTVVIDLTCDTVITVNTSAPMTFEAMSIRGGHTVTFKFADDKTEEGRANKLMPVLAEILENTTVITQYAAYETLGAKLRLGKNAHLMFSYAGLDPWEVLGLTIDGQVSSAIEMSEGSTVEVVKPDMAGLNGYVDFELIEEGGAYYVSVGRVPGASLEVTWDSSVTSWTAGAKGKITRNGKTYYVIIQEGDIVHFAGTNDAVDMGDGSAMPNVQLIVDAGAKVTMTGRPNTSTINGDGTVAFTEKNLDLTSANISGTATLEIAADQTVNANTLSTPVKGSGKLVVTSLPNNLKTYLQNAANWTGTIVIKNVSGVRDLDLANYGNLSSTVELDGVSGFFVNNAHSFGGTVVIGNGGLTINDGYSTYGVYKFAKLGGTGTISMTKGTVHHKFMIGDYSGFTGMIKTTGSPFTVGSIEEAATDGTIKVVAGGSLTASNLTQVDFANGKVGVETDVTVTGAFTKGIVLKSVLSTVTGPVGLNVSTSVEGKVVKTKVVEGNTVYGVVTDAVPEAPVNPGSTIPVTPSAGTGTIAITDAEGATIEGDTLPMTTGKYTVKVVENDFEVASEEYAVIAIPEVTAKTTTAVAVAFDNMTVATLLNNSLLSEGDTLTAYVGGAYWMWTLNGAGLWESAAMVRSGSAEGAPIASETSLARGTAVWVTTAGKIVTFGKYNDKPVVMTPTETHSLYANTSFTSEDVSSVVEAQMLDKIINPADENPTPYVYNGLEWTRQTMTVDNKGIAHSTKEAATPKVKVGQGFFYVRPTIGK